MNLESPEQHSKNESPELSSEEIADLRELESRLISLPSEQDKITGIETPEDNQEPRGLCHRVLDCVRIGD